MTDYEKIKEIYDEIDRLIQERVTASSPDFKNWHSKTERFLFKHYGEIAHEYERFMKLYFDVIGYTKATSENDRVELCRSKLETVKADFMNYLKEMEEEEQSMKNVEDYRQESTNPEVFIVYGHDSELRTSVMYLVERQGIKPLVLDKLENRGRTIIEKLEKYTEVSKVSAGICLFTADDVGREKNEDSEKERARQNVVFETGFLIGKLGREKIIILSDTNVEIPSDLNGVIYTKTKEWEYSVLQELEGMGHQIDYKLLHR